MGHAVGGLGGGAGDELVGVDDWGVVNVLTRGFRRRRGRRYPSIERSPRLRLFEFSRVLTEV